jgi:hypothetical protein
MNATECNKRACECAASAAIAPVEYLALEFLQLAAQWRVMAARENFLGALGEHPAPTADLKA